MAAPDAVAVGFRLGLPAGVEIRADFLCGGDADCGREQGIQGALEFGGGEGGLRFEMGDLAEGVDAGIGAACAVDEDFFLSDLAGGFGDGALDGRLGGLDLPAVEGGAVVGDGEFEVAHCEVELSHGGRHRGTKTQSFGKLLPICCDVLWLVV